MRFSMALSLLVLLTPSLFSMDFYETRTDHYLIKSDISSSAAANTGYSLEKLYAHLVSLIGYPDNINYPLAVMEFTDKKAFDAYLAEAWDVTSENYLLIRQGSSGYGELFIYRKEGKPDNRELAYLAAYQFLEAANRQTPPWLKEGISRFFEPFLDGADSFNWALWRIWSSEDTPGEEIRAWARIQYLTLSSGRDARFFYENLTLIKRGADDFPAIPEELDLRATLFLREVTPPERLSDELRHAFLKDDFEEVRTLLESYGEEKSWLGYYYQGLMHFEQGLFEQAHRNITLALEMGAPGTKSRYLLGLCLLEIGNREEGIALLRDVRAEEASLIPSDISPLLD